MKYFNKCITVNLRHEVNRYENDTSKNYFKEDEKRTNEDIQNVGKSEQSRGDRSFRIIS